MTVLFDPRAHEPVLAAPWDQAAIEAEIRAIARDAEDGLRGRDWWAVHPLDAQPGDPARFHGVYLGAAGMVWGLDRLVRAGLHETRHDHARLAQDVLASYLERPEFGRQPSLWIGLGGITLVAWLLAPSPAAADRLAGLVGGEVERDSLELMWGSPGLLVIAATMLERTGEPRWKAAWDALADRLLAQRGAHVPGLWTQDLYGSRGEILGPAHGSAGIVAALARHRSVDADVFKAAAIRAGAFANWPPALAEGLVHRTGTIRTQWCHGAPGIVCSLADLPADDALDELLLAGAELTWAAGPLRKGANLCHGTAGNGFAFLKLFARTGDERWLARARAFATHAAAQVATTRREHGHGRHTLWTGDLGTAHFLQQCISGDAQLPALESW